MNGILFIALTVEEMNSSSSSMGYAVPVAVLGLFALYYFNGTDSILKPTAQQTLSNKAFVSFIVTASIVAAVVIISMQTKSVSFFFAMIAGLSLLWFVFSKSWQYIPG